MKFNAAASQKTVNPFWVRTSSDDSTKKIFKQVFKWSKLLIYLFLTVIGLWGCFQTFFDYSVATSPNMGEGLEIAFSYGQTGDWRFDALGAQGIRGESYLIFNDFTMDYGPFYGLFVWPASKMVMALMYALRGLPGGLNVIFSLIILLIIIRLITIAVSLKATLQNERTVEIQNKVAEVTAKYKGLNDSLSKQRKQMEIMALYKKNNFRPLAPIEQVFISMPIFLIIFRIVTSTRPIKATILFNIWDLSKQPFNMVFYNISSGGAWFILFLAILISVQVLQAIVPQRLAKSRNTAYAPKSQMAKDEYRKRMMMQWGIQIAFIAMTSLSAAGVGLYYIFNSLTTILQSYLIHKYVMSKKGSDKLKIEDIKIAEITTKK